MSGEYLTSADILAVNTSADLVGFILAANQKIPELARFAASPVKGSVYKTVTWTALPSAGFRAINEGIKNTGGTLEQRTVECSYLDATWRVDNAAFSALTWGNADAEFTRTSLLAALNAWQKQIYNTANDGAGFPGLDSLFPYIDSAGVIDGGGSAPSTGSSVYLIKTGTQDASVVWGNDGTIMAGDRYPTTIYDGSGNPIGAQARNVEGWAGLQLSNHLSVVRIANLTAEDGCTLSDVLLNQAEALFLDRTGEMPDFISMGHRSLAQLWNSRQTLQTLGNESRVIPAATPTASASGTPIIHSKGITATETILENNPS